MKKRLLATIILIIYSAILIKVMVFKDIPPIRIGSLILNFGGTDASRPANFVPFKTIVPYLLGDKGLIIAGINLVGNIALLVPLGFLLPFVYRNITWKKSLVLAVAAGLAIEGMQVILRVGIFDIDDVILNALGVMIGYLAFTILAKWVHSRNYKNIVITAIIGVVAITIFYGTVVYPITHQPMNSERGAGPDAIGAGGGQSDRFGKEKEGEIPQSGDLCGETDGNGQIVSVGNNTFVINQKGKRRIIYLTDQAMIKTSAGAISVSDLKEGYRVTLVGGPNPDGSFTADTVVVCGQQDDLQ